MNPASKVIELVGKFFHCVHTDGLDVSLRRSTLYAAKRLRPGYCFAPPHRLTIATTLKCNLRCPMCITQKSPMDRSRLPCMQDDLFRKIVDDCFPLIKIAHLSIDGEPLMASNLDFAIAMAKYHNVKLDITTNGTLWCNEKMVKRILPVLNGAFFSIEAASKETYESIRSGAKFEKVIDNMKSFNRLRLNLNGRHRPRFIITAVLMRKNIEELTRLVELAHSIGVDEIWTQHVKIYQEAFAHESLLFYKELANNCFAEARARANELHFKIALPPPYDLAGAPHKKSKPQKINIRPELCPYLWKEAMITIQGDVLPCCNAHPAIPIMGNVAKQNFLKIWNNGLYRSMRISLLREEPFECCQHCSFLLGQPLSDDEDSHLQYKLKKF